MSSLVVLKFDDSNGAENALDTVKRLQEKNLLTLVDAAQVTWPEGKKKPKTRQLMSTTAFGALDGTFWGMLFGLIFFVPFIGAAVGAGIGALTGALTDVGIDDDFIKDVRSQVTEGTSALFLMVTDVTADRVIPELKKDGAEVIETNLSSDEDKKLREAFAS